MINRLCCYCGDGGVRSGRRFCTRRCYLDSIGLSEGEVDEAKILYNNGLSTIKIAERLEVSDNTVNRCLRRSGSLIRSRSQALRGRPQPAKRRHWVAAAAFCGQDEASRYWIGFLMGDGTIAGGRALRVELGRKDKNHLYKLRSHLQTSAPICERLHRGAEPGQEVCYLSVSGFELGRDLAQWNVVPGRGATGATRGGLEFDKDFWRGVLDADGSIRFAGGYPSLQLVGRRGLLEQFQGFLLTRNVCKTNARVLPKGNSWEIRLHGEAAADTARFLYADSTVALARKEKTAREFIEWQPMKGGE